ncbi:hypothetical protein LOTGIDRAFT_157489 [Lottia gigantea]|uniref:MARVEL domain-containing protein n=1 Tax=Lottia gigantea TaxID=225164 RepID=V4B1T2_LOTGI|nr:hypothetical protein LOTGIDRAFT_157489 [Lottia gigantea]ESP01311.1 hypothetical protein LOTGIDRAFT_157489 [Lottia gigantea]
MEQSIKFIISLICLLLAAGFYFVALATSYWSVGRLLIFGLWQYCYVSVETVIVKNWKCHPNNTDFTMSAQIFSILAVMCYLVAFLLFMISAFIPSKNKSRPVIMTICLLTFCIVSLQIMSMVVFAVKINEYFRKIQNKHFENEFETVTISWSFVIGIVSNVICTVSGVCIFVDLRNLAIDELDGLNDLNA